MADPPQISRKKSYAILTTCLLECLFLAGSLFGWPSLAYVLKQDGIFSQFCQTDTGSNATSQANHSSVIKPENSFQGNDTIDVNQYASYNYSMFPSCPEQDIKLSNAFPFGVAGFCIVSFASGWLFDKYGMRPIRIISWILITLAYITLAFAKRGVSSWFIYPAMFILGIGCNILVMTNCHLCVLAGRRTSTFITLYNGALNVSATMYLLIKLIYEAGIPRVYILLVYAALCGLTLLNAVFLLPKHKVQSTQEVSEAGSDELKNLRAGYDEEGNHGPTQSNNIEKGDVKRMTIRSALFISFTIWFAILHVRVISFISFFSPWIRQIKGDLDGANRYTTVFGITSMAAAILAPVSGILIDSRRKHIAEKGLRGVDRAIATLVPVSISTFAALLLSVSVLIKSEVFIYTSMVLEEILRAFLYATGIAVLEIAFPSSHFGILFGITYFCMGIATFLQFPLTEWMEASGFLDVNIFLIVVNCVSFILPVCIVYRYWFRRDRTPE